MAFLILREIHSEQTTGSCLIITIFARRQTDGQIFLKMRGREREGDYEDKNLSM